MKKNKDLKRYEIMAPFVGCLFVNILATSEEKAKEDFLISLGGNYNFKNEYSSTFHNVRLIDGENNINIDELNILFPKKITEINEFNDHYTEFDIEEIDLIGSDTVVS